jgi:hypothetical protein
MIQISIEAFISRSTPERSMVKAPQRKGDGFHFSVLAGRKK